MRKESKKPRRLGQAAVVAKLRRLQNEYVREVERYARFCKAYSLRLQELQKMCPHQRARRDGVEAGAAWIYCPDCGRTF
jgi:hypothetical protein